MQVQVSMYTGALAQWTACLLGGCKHPHRYPALTNEKIPLVWLVRHCLWLPRAGQDFFQG